MATGKYVGFVDSDDVISPFLYEKLVHTIETEDADWIACEFTRKYDDLQIENSYIISGPYVAEGIESILSILICAPSIRNITWTSSYVWNKLYRRDAITELFKIDCSHSEDLQFNWDYLQNNHKLAIVPSVLYFYRLNGESITEAYRKSITNDLIQRSYSIVCVNEQIAEQISDDSSVLKQYMIARTVNVMHGALFRMYKYDAVKRHEEFCIHISKYIRSHWRTV